jgi:DNA-binding CsgD family transcriptional regulator
MPRSLEALPPDCVSLVECLYDLEADESTWLALIARRACDGLGVPHLGGYALTYDASDIADCRFPAIVSTTEVASGLDTLLRQGMAEVYRRHPPLVDAVFRRVSHAMGSELPLGEAAAQVQAALGSFGVGEILGINGINLDGRGLHVGVFVASGVAAPEPELLGRLASHLAAASRLRRRLGSARRLDEADAVLDPSGALAHAQPDGGAMLEPARRTLAEAVVRLEHARSRVRKRDPGEALSQWTALVDARWSLVDHFEQDGKRYIVAERNDAEPGPLEVLTRRERQVVSLAALGHANKMIAYELGIAVSTAGVLLSRARRKLSASSRQELIALYRTKAGLARLSLSP